MWHDEESQRTGCYPRASSHRWMLRTAGRLYLAGIDQHLALVAGVLDRRAESAPERRAGNLPAEDTGACVEPDAARLEAEYDEVR